MKLSMLMTWGGIAALVAGVPASSKSIQAATSTLPACGGSTVGWAEPGLEGQPFAKKNRLDVGASAISWNGVPIKATTMLYYFAQVRSMSPQPMTVLIVDPKADCARIATVQRMMNARLECSSGYRCVAYSQAQWAARKPPAF